MAGVGEEGHVVLIVTLIPRDTVMLDPRGNGHLVRRLLEKELKAIIREVRVEVVGNETLTLELPDFTLNLTPKG